MARQRRKHPFLLLEIIIGLFLIGIISSLLFSFLLQCINMENKIAKAKSAVIEKEYLQATLQDIFSSLYLAHEEECLRVEKKDSKNNESLILYFDHGIDIEPEFSGLIVANIFVDATSNDLQIVYYPLKQTSLLSKKRRVQTLCRNVKGVIFEGLFLVAKKSAKKKYHWDLISSHMENFTLPSCIRMKLLTDTKTEDFVFVTANDFPLPTYP